MKKPYLMYNSATGEYYLEPGEGVTKNKNEAHTYYGDDDLWIPTDRITTFKKLYLEDVVGYEPPASQSQLSHLFQTYKDTHKLDDLEACQKIYSDNTRMYKTVKTTLRMFFEEAYPTAGDYTLNEAVRIVLKDSSEY